MFRAINLVCTAELNLPAQHPFSQCKSIAMEYERGQAQVFITSGRVFITKVDNEDAAKQCLDAVCAEFGATIRQALVVKNGVFLRGPSVGKSDNSKIYREGKGALIRFESGSSVAVGVTSVEEAQELFDDAAQEDESSDEMSTDS